MIEVTKNGKSCALLKDSENLGKKETSARASVMETIIEWLLFSGPQEALHFNTEHSAAEATCSEIHHQ